VSAAPAIATVPTTTSDGDELDLASTREVDLGLAPALSFGAGAKVDRHVSPRVTRVHGAELDIHPPGRLARLGR